MNALARNGHNKRRSEQRALPPREDATMPHSVEAEESVIGGILVHPAKLAEVQSLLQPDHFYHPAMRAIYEAFDTLDHYGKPIDALTVLEQMRALETADKLTAFGGPDFLTDLMAKVVPMNIGYHARIVHAKATARAVVTAAREIAARGMGDYGDLDVYVQEAQRELAEAASRAKQLVAHHPNIAATLRSDAFRLAQETYPTCFQGLNEMIAGGAKARQLTVIAAPTGAGKTGFLSTIALAWAHDGIPVLWVCTEIDPDEQAARFAAIEYRNREMFATPDDFLSLRMDPDAASRTLDQLPIFTLHLDEPDEDAFSIIKARAEEIRRQTGRAPVVVLDYLQVLAVEDEQARRMSVTKVSTNLRRLARELNTAIIAISSVSRAYYGRAAAKKTEGEEENPIEWLAAAKDSGDIEYSSAVFAYLETDKDVDTLGEASARLIVAKSRRGRRGFVGLRFHGPSGRFVAAGDVLTRTGSRAQQVDDKVLRFVHGPVYQPMTRRQLREAVPNARSIWVDDAVARLLDSGHLALQKHDGKDGLGRTRTVFLVVPATPKQENTDGASR